MELNGVRTRRAFTMVEVMLVAVLLAAVAALVLPSFFGEFQAAQLPTSARQMRSFVAMARAHAQFDGRRYRIRFPGEDEDKADTLGSDRQPLVEREDDPIDEPGVFNLVTEPWAVGETLLAKVWCAEVRLGRPTVEMLLEERNAIEDALTGAVEDFDPLRPPLIIEPDGTSDWATFVLTQAPRDIEFDALKDEVRIEVIVDGETGIAWLQRPLYDEEVDLFDEHHWPVVLRQDFLDPRVLTEDDVLELQESRITP